MVSVETLSFIKSLCDVPVRNKIIPQSKFVKLSMKPKFERNFLLTLAVAERNKKISLEIASKTQFISYYMNLTLKKKVDSKNEEIMWAWYASWGEEKRLTRLLI